jgi:hypothetical protein
VFTSKAMAQANRSRNACCRRWWDLGKPDIRDFFYFTTLGGSSASPN